MSDFIPVSGSSPFCLEGENGVRYTREQMAAAEATGKPPHEFEPDGQEKECGAGIG